MKKNELAVIKSVETRVNEIMARIKVFERDEELWTDSLSVAEVFGKDHNNLTKVIRKIDEENQLVNLVSFNHIKYVDSRGREQDAFEMTETGFFALVARFNDQKDKDISLIRSCYLKEFDRLKKEQKKKELSPNDNGINSQIQGLIISVQKFIDYVDSTTKQNQSEHIMMQSQVNQVDAKVIKLTHTAECTQSRVIDIEKKLDNVIEMNQKRRGISEPNRRTHINYLFHRFDGKCPCCFETQILDRFKNPIPNAFEIDHFYKKNRNALDETWPVCKDCNSKFENGGFDRINLEGFFAGYHAGLREWKKRQKKALQTAFCFGKSVTAGGCE